ncbi:MAG: endonuclease/exonuclease/phosphatase family protein, partial [Anaerolineales bacterium]
MLLPSLVWFWGATLGMRVELVVLYAYAPIVLALLAPLLVGWLKPRGALWAVGAGLMLCRLVLQVSTPPDAKVWAALGGSACSLGLLLLLFGRARAEAEDGLQTFVLGLLLGLSLDTALRGLTGTLDLSWIPGPWPWLMVVALVGTFGYALWRITRNEVSLQDEDFLSSLPLIGLGPLLFAEWQILQNQGWAATLTGWSPGLALGWIMLGNVGALLAAAYAFTSFRLRSTGWWPLLPGGALTFALLFAEVPGWTFALGLLVGLVSAGALLAVIVGEVGQPASRGGIGRAGFAIWLGLLLLSTLVMLYYFSFLVRLLPFPRSALAPLAGGGLTLCAVGAAWLRPRVRATRAPQWTPARLCALLLLVPLGVLMAEALRAPRSALAKGYPVRLMTYNIRSAYGMEGRQDVEAIAQVIEGAGTEVVALQELSRGWFLNGGTDLLPLLARRLNMPYTVMGAATDPLFGNAILSRYPILASG